MNKYKECKAVSDSPKNFFISYNNADRLWAEWIAWQLQTAHYTIELQPQDFFLEPSFTYKMQSNGIEAECTIVVLSPKYLDELYERPELVHILEQGQERKPNNVLPVHVRECRSKLGGIFPLIDCVDLVQLDEMEARDRLLEDVVRKRTKLIEMPAFPGQTHQQIVDKQPRYPESLPPTLPYQRNLFFTGREEIISHLYKVFNTDKASAKITQPQALSGLSGIGKTQIAVEYAYRYYKEYSVILWANANTYEELATEFENIAYQLNLSEKGDLRQNHVVNAVKLWLKNNKDWLLILDDVDDLPILRNVIPLACRGHILLTTQAQAVGGLAQRIQVENMQPEEGTLFLLRRAKITAPNASISDASDVDRFRAREISGMMEGLPLALDQAGAYIEKTACGLARYLELYKKLGTDLLKQPGDQEPQFRAYQSQFESHQPKTVMNTWTLSFEKVKQANPAAVELLHFCVFLHPVAIPEELITLSVPYLGTLLKPVATTPLKLDAAIEELRRFSLIRRDPDNHTLAIHRLVQAVLRETMDEKTAQIWKQRAIQAVNHVFPEVEFATWNRCQRYIPHVLACTEHIERSHVIYKEAIRLLHLAAFYSWQRAQYVLSRSLYEKALAIQEEALKQEKPDLANAARSHDFALLYRSLGEYSRAKELFSKALVIREMELERCT